MIPKETEARILRYHHVEKWPVGTIAKQVGVPRSTALTRMRLALEKLRVLRSKNDAGDNNPVGGIRCCR